MSTPRPPEGERTVVARVYSVEACSTPGGIATATTKATAIAFDASAGQSDAVPGPADLMTAAFAACVLKNVERFSHLLAFRYRWAAISVESERQDTPPRMIALRYVLRIGTDEPPQRLRLLHLNIRRRGTVFNTLAAACDVTGEILAESA